MNNQIKDINRFFFPDEWKRFIKELDKPKYKNRMFYELQFQTGARFDEVRHLRPIDFDFERNNVRLWKTKTKAKKGEKVGKPRTISLSSDFSRKIKKFCSDKKPDEYLWEVSQAGFNQLMKAKIKKLGIKDYTNFSSHNIRKTHGMYLKSLGIKELWFKDLTFGANKERTQRLLNRMLDEQLRFTWVCLSRVNVLDEELLTLMKLAGCHTIQLGIETADEKLLGQYSKPFTREQVEHTVAMCKKVGIRILAHFILGLPGDTEENINATIRLALELKPEFASFNVAMPRMGTQFRQKALHDGLVSSDVTTLDNSISFPVYETPQLSREKLWQLRNKAIRTFHLRPGFIIRRLLGVKSLYELKTLFIEGIALLTTTLKSPGRSE